MKTAKKPTPAADAPLPDQVNGARYEVWFLDGNSHWAWFGTVCGLAEAKRRARCHVRAIVLEATCCAVYETAKPTEKA